MRKYRKWVLTLGLVATAPGVTLAGPFDFLKPDAPAAARPAANKPGNQQVAENIAEVLKRAKLEGHDIEISFQGGVARISGKVHDAGQKAKVTALASRVPGVERVDNQLTIGAEPASQLVANPFNEQAVTPAAGGGAAPAAANPFTAQTPDGGSSNQQMAESVAQALKKERLSGYDIQIRFRNGTVLLAGAVKDAEQRARAEKAAAAVPGVQHVENQLIVPGTPPGNWMAGPQRGPAPRPGQPPIQPVNYQPFGDAAPPGPMPLNGAMPPEAAGVPVPAVPPAGPMPGMTYGHPGAAGGGGPIYNMPYMPEYAWPATAQYPNSAAVQYPTQYSASAWPYIGPFYPYPQVPLGWRQAQLEWDDGHWHLNFRPRTDKWWWFLHPKNW